MKTLDRYILRSFLSSVAMWFVVFMALRVVADLLVNMDEFLQLDRSLSQTLRTIAVYYSYQSLTYFTEMGGVIIVAGASFTLAMMNRNNELTAMLASGMSLYRVIAPIVFCSILLSGLIVLDEELVIPPVADRLVRGRDDVEGLHLFPIRLMPDGIGNIWFAVSYDPSEGTMHEPVVIVRDAQGQALARVTGRQASPAVADGQSGWEFTRGVLSRLKPGDQGPWENPPRWNQVYSSVGPEAILRACGLAGDAAGPVGEANVADPAYGMVILADGFDRAPAVAGQPRGGTLRRPRFIFSDAEGKVLGAFLGSKPSSAAFWRVDRRGRGYWALEDGVLFFPSDLSAKDLVLRRGSRWIEFMSTKDLSALLRLKNVPNFQGVLLTRHMRFAEPINNLVMLLLGLPFILSRERNVKSSATLCLLMVGTFFAFVQVCRQVDLPATLAAWLPILLFGPVAAVMLDSVKT